MLAAGKGSLDACTSLLACRADPTVRDKTEGATALIYGIHSGSVAPAITQLLLENAAVVDARDKSERTPIMTASIRGDTNVAKLLLEHSADVQCKAISQEFSAKAMGVRNKVVQTFINGRTRNPVSDYAAVKRSEEAALQIAREMETERQRTYEEDLAHASSITSFVEQGSREQYDIHEEEDLSVDTPVSDIYSEELYVLDGPWMSRLIPLRPIDMRSPQSPSECQRHMLQARALREIHPRKAGAGDMALVLAARHGHAHMCDLLLHYGAHATERDGTGESALSVAARAGHVEVLRSLLTSPTGPPSLEERKAAALLADAGSNEAAVQVLHGYMPYASVVTDIVI
jgi:ankyrin repeat protein